MKGLLCHTLTTLRSLLQESTILKNSTQPPPTSGLNSFLCHLLMESKFFNWFGILFDRPFSQYINFCCHFKTKSSSKHWSGKKVDRVWIRPHVCMDFYRKELRYDESNYMDRSPRQLSFRINWKCLNRTFGSRDINLIVSEVVILILLKPWQDGSEMVPAYNISSVKMSRFKEKSFRINYNVFLSIIFISKNFTFS